MTVIFRKGLPTIFSIEKIFNALYDRLVQSGMRLQRLELPHVSTGILSVLRNAWFVACRRRAHVLHISGDVHYATLLCLFSKTIITIHDCVVLQRGTGFKRWVLWWLWFGLPVRRASAVVVISEQTRRELLDTVDVPAAKISVIPNFVDPAFEFSHRQFAHDMPRILHVGTTPNKNLLRVVSALEQVACVLVIVGPLSEAVLEALRRGGVRYENLVAVDHARMTRLYRDADIVSFPSTYEGFGMPILEGQAVGRPVLTSDLDPMRSVAGPGGALLVDPYSVSDIREGFLSLLRDSALRSRLVAAGRQNCARYTLESVVASYDALYRRIGAGRAG
jgi:glycosyltransferase involved in cell wall biosynthesis